MKLQLMVDFGSTYTKLTAVDIENCEIVATSKAITTVSTDISIGYESALAKIFEQIGEVKFEKIVACSSAAGGLKMAAIGLVPKLTVEAAKRVCLGAGAKVQKVFAFEMTNAEAKEIRDGEIDIILLAGGTNGGNRDCVVHNAKKIAAAGIKIPVIYAGNKSAQDDISEIFDLAGVEYYICENVMPEINVLNINSARDQIKEVFMKKIIEAKGIKKIENEIDQVVLPTPNAVLCAAELLSKGYGKEKGLGELVLVDIGGATTDMYSMTDGMPKQSNVILKGLEEPYSKRTVEGDLGMRYSSHGVVLAMQPSRVQELMVEEGIDMNAEADKRRQNIEMVPSTEQEFYVERIFGGVCSDVAMTRHVGTIESYFTPEGKFYLQYGKDLSGVGYVIGTGGVVINSPRAKEMLQDVCASPASIKELRPTNPQYLLDASYILSAMGLLSLSDPLVALKIMKKKMKLI